MVGYFYINMEFKSKYNYHYKEFYKEYLKESLGELRRCIDHPESLDIKELFKEMEEVSQIAGDDVKSLLQKSDEIEYTRKMSIDLSVMLRTYRHNIVQALDSLSILVPDETIIQLKYKKVVKEKYPSLNLKITNSSNKKPEVLNVSFPYELAKYNMETVIIFSYFVGYLVKMVVHNSFRKR